MRSFFLGGKHPRASDVSRFLQALREEDGAPLSKLAATSGLGERRAAVICAGLEALHLVRRAGRLRKLTRPLNDAELSTFLDKFTSRHAADRERLSAMMRYGEMTRCRMKYIREYFGAPPEENCNHCDNCKAFEGL